MNDTEIMDLVAEEGFVKSPKKVRQKLSSTIEDYIDEFEKLISQIRMKHDKSIPLARTMGGSVTDDMISKSKKDLEKILRRYRALTIEKLEELADQIDDIKNPLKAEAQGKVIAEKADEIHDERFKEIKDFMESYKPVWVKELASESGLTPTPISEPELSISAEQAQRIGDRIAAIKQAKPHFENTKKRILTNYKSEISKAIGANSLNEYIDGLKQSISKNIETKSTGKVSGEEHSTRQGTIKVILRDINRKKEDLVAYGKKVIDDITDAINSLDYRAYANETKDARPAVEGAREIFEAHPEMKTSNIDSWIKKKCAEIVAEKSGKTIDEHLKYIREMRTAIKGIWEEEGVRLKEETDNVHKKQLAAHREDEARRLEAEKAAEEVRLNRKEKLAKATIELYKNLDQKVKNGEMKKEDMLRTYKRESQALRTSMASESFVDNVGITGVDAAFFVGGAVLGSLLFNGLISKKEDVDIKSIPGAKAYQYLLNDEFLKAEKTMKKILKSNQTFEVNKVVAREIHKFKNEYYRPVAYCINKFLDFYDDIKPELFKEKKYYFESPNTARDEAIYKKISEWRSLLINSCTESMRSKVAEIENYAPAYTSGTDCETIRVDAKFLDGILNIEKTFAVLESIEEALKDLPDPSKIDLFNKHSRALSYYHLPIDPNHFQVDNPTCPLHAYIMYEYMVAQRMKEMRDMFIQYLTVIYDILNYTRYVDGK